MWRFRIVLGSGSYFTHIQACDLILRIFQRYSHQDINRFSWYWTDWPAARASSFIRTMARCFHSSISPAYQKGDSSQTQLPEMGTSKERTINPVNSCSPNIGRNGGEIDRWPVVLEGGRGQRQGVNLYFVFKQSDSANREGSYRKHEQRIACPL